MGKYRKKPVVIEARKVVIGHNTEFDDLVKWCGGKAFTPERLDQVAIDIETLEGTMRANLGDYIIKGVQGEFYPCKPDIFEATYEEVRNGDIE